MMAPENRGRTVILRVTMLVVAATVLVLACLSPPHTPPALAQTETDRRCVMDFDANTYIDISDITQLTGRFGLAAPPEPAKYDIQPLLSGDGFIDINDISYTTNYFGGTCYGITATQEMSDVMMGSSYLCRYVGVSWLLYQTPTHIYIGGFSPSGSSAAWWGATACEGNHPEAEYSIQCAFGIYENVGGSWTARAVTFTAEAQGLGCGANGWNVAVVTKCHDFKYGMQHATWHLGAVSHPNEFHMTGQVYNYCD